MPVDSHERMAVVPYQEVLSEVGDLHCLICDSRTSPPLMLHDTDCPHCPCQKCTLEKVCAAEDEAAGRVDC
jgi:hypothetical protein